MPLYNYDFCSEIKRYFYARAHFQIWKRDLSGVYVWEAIDPLDINWYVQPAPSVRKIVEGHYLTHYRHLVSIYNEKYHREKSDPINMRRNCRPVADLANSHHKIISGVISNSIFIMRGMPPIVKYVAPTVTDEHGREVSRFVGLEHYFEVPFTLTRKSASGHDIIIDHPEEIYPPEEPFNKIEADL